MKVIRLVVLFAGLLAVSSSCAAKPQLASKVLAKDTKTYNIKKSYSTVSFTATKWMVFKEEGLFEEFSGTFVYNAGDPAACKIDVTVQAASLDTRHSGGATKCYALTTSSTSKNIPRCPFAARTSPVAEMAPMM